MVMLLSLLELDTNVNNVTWKKWNGLKNLWHLIAKVYKLQLLIVLLSALDELYIFFCFGEMNCGC